MKHVRNINKQVEYTHMKLEKHFQELHINIHIVWIPLFEPLLI